MDEDTEIKVKEMRPQQLKAMLESGAPPMLLDVREAWEVALGKIEGAVHIPMNWIPHRLDELPREKTIVVYCASGMRSYAVAEYLLGQGFKDARNLEGGIEAWVQL